VLSLARVREPVPALAARLGALAGPGEVLVTCTVADLPAGATSEPRADAGGVAVLGLVGI
jgi:class 3 adenylate cyclase